MPNMIVRIRKPLGGTERFRALSETERLDSVVNSHGDLTILRYSLGDPYEIRHTIAILAAGQWNRVDQGFENVPETPCTLTKGCWLEAGHEGHCD